MPFTELRTATDLALRATKVMMQALGKAMASLVVLERHLWLNLTDIRDAEKMAFLNSPVSLKGLLAVPWTASLSSLLRPKRHRKHCIISWLSAPARRLFQAITSQRPHSTAQSQLLHKPDPDIQLLPPRRQGVSLPEAPSSPPSCSAGP